MTNQRTQGQQEGSGIGEKYKQENLFQVQKAESTESEDTIHYIDGLLSPFIRNTDSWIWESTDFYTSIQSIYKEALKPLREEITQRSKDELAVLSQSITTEQTPQGRSMEDIVAESRIKARDVTTILKGWIGAAIRLFDVHGSEEGKITIKIFKELQRMLPGIEKLTKSEPKNQEIFSKLMHGTGMERLNPSDYEYLADQTEPVLGDNKGQINGNEQIKRADFRADFQKQMTGMMMGMMNPLERMNLTQAFIAKEPNDAKKFVEAMVATDMLTIAQGQELFEKHSLGKFDGRKLTEQQNKTKQAVERIAAELSANYYDNPARRFLTIKSTALVAGGAAGLVAIIFNGASHLMGSDKDYWGALTNEYVWLGGLGMAAAATKLSGHNLTAFASNPGTKPETTERWEQNKGKFIEVLSGNPWLEEYMEKGGLEDSMRLMADQQKLPMEKRMNEIQYLTVLLDMAPVNTEKGNGLRSGIAQSNENIAIQKILEATHLAREIKIDQATLPGIVNEYKTEQGIK